MARLSSDQVRRENNDRDPSSITSLDLSLRALSDVSCLSDFQNLGRLDVSCNGLTTLEGLSQCINLKWLSVAQNKLKSLRGIESLSKLTVLNASKNMLRSMDEVRSLTELRALILNDNEISSICKLDQLKYLNTLVLSRNPIYEIGSSLKNSNSVTKLSLSKCKIQIISSSLISALYLKELRLADNEITSLPTELGRNIKLQNLDLGKNLIMRLSELKVLSELHNLKNLNLQGNPVAENPKLIKKIRKMVPGLQIFNAKPIEKWNQGNIIAKRDISAAIKSDQPPEDAIVLESEQTPKRKKSNADATTSGKRRSDAINATLSHPDNVEAKEAKMKKHKVVENVLDEVISSTKEGKKSPFGAYDAKEKKTKEKKLAKVDRKSYGFDDSETSFMDLVLSGDVHEKPVSELSVLQAARDEKLLGGVVVDHTKKIKGKKARRRLPAIQVYSQVPDFGMGGPSTWDD